ncbi:hypothetical protein BT96DRAFT_1024042 [Gymnopus androsaceus JB14]|uniref:Peptidase C14 caspase domain-containing protein n=1 Tax=Gymnopus androsaceus JB14 TaxID=1447944 RepID=A0A6A4H1B8_9AGAR|nr:hypothetical protein BT96DRAFT_1024042 [Gymnopus androsaceus JB14]
MSPHDRRPTFPNLWALVIGIEKYENLVDYERIEGPLADVDGVEDFLNDLGVPEKNVLILRDGDATRKEIISAFETHFIHNEKIPPNSPLLFYYSGHGGRLAAPSGWPVLESFDEHNKRLETKVEVLVPSDCTNDCDKDGRPSVHTIPDRTINSLLLSTAQKHGDNITIILDCCHSAHLNRKPTPGLKTIPENALPRLLPDTDSEIWGRDDTTAKNEQKRGGIAMSMRRLLGDEATRSHVLLAACAKDQVAWTMPRSESEEPGENGSIFTTFLLSILNDKLLRTNRGQLTQNLSEITQRLLVGCFNGLVFEPFQDERRFETTRLSDRELKVHAGHIHAVAHDTEFALFRGVQSKDEELRRNLRPSSSRPISAISCFIDLPRRFGVDKSVSLYASIVSQGSGHALKTCASSEALSILQTQTRSRRDWNLVSPDSKPDIIIEPDNSGLKITRRDRFLRDSAAEVLRVPRSGIPAFQEHFDQIALFNFHLSHEPVGSPRHYCHGVELNIGEFQDAAYGENRMKVLEAASFCPRTLNEVSGNEEIKVDSRRKYGVVIKNNTLKSLFFYVVFFDPYDYSVTVWYHPVNEKACVRKDGTLQLGQSSEHAEMLEFELVEDRKQDIGFMKVYISPNYTSLHSLNQDGFGAGTFRADSNQNLEDLSVGHEWDCICFTVISENE